MRTLDLAVSVFGVIFIAELPDKTALAALVLATRHKAMPVFVGSALALAVQSVVAVAAGSLFSRLPPRVVHVGAAAVFLVSAGIMWVRRDGQGQSDDPGDSPAIQAGVGFWKTSMAAFAVVFVAEWGDLTQLATAAFAARERAPLVVFGASTLALWAVTAIAVAIGNRTARLLSPEVVQRVAALVFAAVGLALLFGWI